MAEKKKFDIAQLMGAAAVSNLDTGRVQMIPFDKLVPNPKNQKLSMPDIEAMADDIEYHGRILEPLLVKPAGESYMILSGHRRHAGGTLLRKRRPDLLETVPCMILQPENDAEENMIMVSANKQRPKTDADLMDELERTREALVALKEQGVEVPGKLRDIQAEALNISASKVARLNVIKKGLEGGFMDQFRAGTLPESTAYALARMDETKQIIVLDATKKKVISKNTAEGLLERMGRIYDDDRTCPDGTSCTNAERMLRESCKHDRSWDMCSGCCLRCSTRGSCSRACPEAKTAADKERAASQKAKEKQKAEQERRERDVKAFNHGVACRILAAAKRNGCDLTKLSEANVNWSLPSIEQQAAGENLSSYESAFFPYYPAGYKRIVDFLGCTVDYLMGFSEQPTPEPPAWHVVEEGDLPPEGTFVFVCDKFGAAAHSAFLHGLFMDAGISSVGNNAYRHIGWWMYSPELPGGMSRMGETIIQGMVAKTAHNDGGTDG